MKKTILPAILVILVSLHFCQAAPDNYKLILWNQHNGDLNDRGTRTCKIEALKDGKPIYTNESFKLIWRKNQDNKVSISIPLPAGGVDTFRVTVTEWIGEGGGLAEVEVFKNDKNITKDCQLSTSADFDNRFTVAQLIDGITTSKKKYEGYWLLPDKKEGYIEIKLP